MNSKQLKKPIQLRIIFILNAIMMFLPFVFYYVVTTKNIQLGGLDPMYMVYTGAGYIASFALLVATILSKKINLMRTIFVLNILISIPASAYIGMIVAIISMLISYMSKNVKEYFA